MKDKGVDEIKDLSFFSPGLNIEGGVDNNTTRFFIRGVGTATPTFGTEQSVPIYIDDIYTPLGIGGNIDLFSVDRVEVLSGPQGTLYGRNSLGGAIKIYSKQFTNETEGKVEFGIGSFEQRDVKAEIQTPIIEDKLFIGGAFASIQNDGIQDNVYTGTKGWQDDKELYRIRLEYRPNDDFTAKYTYERNESGGAAKQLRVRPGTAGNIAFDAHQTLLGAYNNALTAAHAAGLDPTLYPLVQPGDAPFIVEEGGPFTGDEDNIFSDIVGENTVEQESHTWNFALDIDENSAVKYLGSHRTQFNTRLFDIDGGPAAFLAGTEEFTFEADSHELRYEFSGERFNLAVGAFYYEEDSDALLAFTQPFGIFAPEDMISGNPGNPVNAILNATAAGDFSTLDFEPLQALQDPLGLYTGTNLVSLRNNLRQNTESKAFYINAGYDVTEDLRVSLGIRTTEDEKEGETPVGNNDGGVLVTTNTSIFPGTGNFIPAGGLGQFYTPESLANSFGLDNDVPGQVSEDDPFGSVGDLDATFRETTVELTLDYSVSDDMLVYGSFKQGFQGGQLLPVFVPEGSGVEQETTPIKINAYELGFKATFNDRVRWNSSIYYYDWDDLILFQTISVPTTQNTFQSVGLPLNSAEATSYGIETDIQWLINDQLSVYGNIAYNDFELDSAERFDSVTGGDIDVTDEFEDRYVSSSPKLQATVGFEYFHGVSNGGELRWWSNISWRDRISVNAQSSFQNAGLNLLSPAQAEENFFSSDFTNVTAGITYTKDEWRVDLSGSNLLDDRRPEAVVNSIQDVFFGTLETYNKPRTWSLTVAHTF